MKAKLVLNLIRIRIRWQVWFYEEEGEDLNLHHIYIFHDDDDQCDFEVKPAPHVGVEEGESSHNCPSMANHLSKYLDNAATVDVYDAGNDDDADADADYIIYINDE